MDKSKKIDLNHNINVVWVIKKGKSIKQIENVEHTLLCKIV